MLVNSGIFICYSPFSSDISVLSINRVIRLIRSGGVFPSRLVRNHTSEVLLRVTSLKGQPHDTRWHEIQIKPNGEAVLVT